MLTKIHSSLFLFFPALLLIALLVYRRSPVFTMSFNVVFPVLLIAVLVLVQAILDLFQSALHPQQVIHALLSATTAASVLHLLILVSGPLYVYLVLPVAFISCATLLGVVSPFIGVTLYIPPILFLLSTLSTFPLVVHLLIQQHPPHTQSLSLTLPHPLPSPTTSASSFPSSESHEKPQITGTFADYKSSILPPPRALLFVEQHPTSSWFSQSDADVESLSGPARNTSPFLRVPALVLAAQLCSVLASAFEIPAAILAHRMQSMTAPLVSTFQILQGIFMLFCLVLVLVAYYRYCLTTQPTSRPGTSRSMKFAPTPPPTPASSLGHRNTPRHLVLPPKPTREIYTHHSTTIGTTTTTFSESLTSLHLPYPSGIPVPVTPPVHTYKQREYAYTHRDAKKQHKNRDRRPGGSTSARNQHRHQDRQAYTSSNESFASPRPKRTPLRVCTTALPPSPSFMGEVKLEQGDDADSVPMPTPTSTTSTSGCTGVQLPVFPEAASDPCVAVGSCGGSVASRSDYSHRAPTPEEANVPVDPGAYTHRGGSDSDGHGGALDVHTREHTATSIVGRPPTPGVYPDGLGRGFGRGVIPASDSDSEYENKNKNKNHNSTNSTNSNTDNGYDYDNDKTRPYPSPGLRIVHPSGYPHPRLHPYTHSYSLPRPLPLLPLPRATNEASPAPEHDFTDLRDPFAPLARTHTHAQAHLVSPYGPAQHQHQHYVLRASLPSPSPSPTTGGHASAHPDHQHVHPTRMSAWGRLQFPVKMPSSPSLRTGAGHAEGLGLGLGLGAGPGALGAAATISGSGALRRAQGERRVPGKGRGEGQKRGARIQTRRVRERVLEDVDGEVEDSALLTQRLLRRLLRQGAGAGGGAGVERSWSFN